jgi:hypothetical protein
MNTFIKGIVFICVSLTLNQAALALPPTINSAIYYTDCWYDNPFGSDGCHEVVCANVEGADFVQVIQEDPYISINLNQDPQGNWWCRFVENDGFTVERLQILAWNYVGGYIDSSEEYTNSLDKIIWMDAAKGISISDFSTSPVVSWKEDPDAQKYYLRVYDSAENEIYRSPQLISPEYQIPNNLLNDFEQYYFRLLNQNYDYDSSSEWHLENRSSTWIGFMPLSNLNGTGKGQSADRRLNAFVNMLNNAVILFEDGDIEEACDQLEAAHKKCDGEPRPPDLVEGDDAEAALEMIEALMTGFGCE